MRYRVEVADRPDALYALWDGRILRARRSTNDGTVLLTVPPGDEIPDGFDTESAGGPSKVVPAAEAGATFAIHTCCYHDDEPFHVEPRSADGTLTLRWAGQDERRAAELGLTGFTTTTDDPDSLTGLWQERHDYAEPGTPRREPGNGDQQALLRAIGRTMLNSLPPGWQRVAAQFRQVGDYSELEVRAMADESTVSVSAPPQLGQLFTQLRSAMYTPEAGTWFQGTFTLDNASNFDFDYDADNEPSWRLSPEGRRTPRTYDAELEYHPRKQVPSWLAAKAGLPLDLTFRNAKVVDGQGEGEKPIVNRPPVPQEEIQHILGYLYRAPIALGRPGTLPDLFQPGGPPNVPDAFHTDGTWIWPAAVPHYLRRYGVPPERDLLDHIRANNHRPPYVPKIVRDTAEADILGKPRPPRPVDDIAEADSVTRIQRGGEPRQPLRASDVLAVLRTRLAEHGVADTAYRIGGESADTLVDGAWWLHRVEDGWELARVEGGLPVDGRRFERVHPAAEALLGALLLFPGRSRLGVPDHAETAEPSVNATDWPILPLRGEPPLTMYTRKRMVTLPAGTIVRRYGNAGGNLVHRAGTTFPETSLAFEREFDQHEYRLARPIHVLTGITEPFGPLPGGGIAYLLPRAIGHHLESGALEPLAAK